MAYFWQKQRRSRGWAGWAGCAATPRVAEFLGQAEITERATTPTLPGSRFKNKLVGSLQLKLTRFTPERRAFFRPIVFRAELIEPARNERRTDTFFPLESSLIPSRLVSSPEREPIRVETHSDSSRQLSGARVRTRNTKHNNRANASPASLPI